MKLNNKNFKCPHCNILSQQNWTNSSQFSDITKKVYRHHFLESRIRIQDYEQGVIEKFLTLMDKQLPNSINNYFPKEVSIANCQACNNFSIWVNETIVYPKQIPIEKANIDMNEDIQNLYEEASLIFLDSPKGATALLRLALQKLLEQLGKTGNINNSIKELVKEGLNPKMQQALDIVRVVGNNAVHPGEINLDDNQEIALSLFKIINMIADDLITKPKEMDELYNDIIPEQTRTHIQTRDESN